MKNLDDRIRDSLSADDRSFLEQLDKGGNSLYGDIAATFQGHLRWVNVLVWIFGFVAFLFALYCGSQFVTAEDPRAMQLWGAGTALAAFMLGLIKLWFWLEVQKCAVLREIKRVELQVAGLASALTNASSGRDAG